jgi:hypothetical protein
MGYIDWPCNQTAVYWPPESSESGGDDFDDYGQPQVTLPVEVNVRWDDKNEEFISIEGTTLTSRSIVLVDQDVEVGGILMLGRMADINSSLDLEDIKDNDNAWEIKRVDRIPNIDADDTLIKAFL